MSDPDADTMRECPRPGCGALNSLGAHVCGVCGSTLGRATSDTFELFADMMRRAIKRLGRLGLDDEGSEMLHEARELATYFGNPSPNGAERNAAINRATRLYQRVLDYRRESVPPTREE